MADSKIEDLTADTTPDGTDIIYATDAAGTVDKKVALEDLPVSDAAQTALDAKANITGADGVDAGLTGVGGSAVADPGTAEDPDALGGNLNLSGGSAGTTGTPEGAGGSVVAGGAEATNTQTLGGVVQLTGGSANGDAGDNTGGGIAINGGAGLASAGGSGIGGDVVIYPGAGADQDGDIYLYDAGGTSLIEINSDGMGFYGAEPVGQQSVTGSTLADVLTSLLVGLETEGLVTDDTSAIPAAQPLDADLSAIAALTSAANKVPYATGAGTWALADFTAAGRSMVAAADAAAQAALLGAEVFKQAQAVNAQTGTTYTLVAGDAGKLVTLSNASGITLTLPQDSDATIAVGTYVDLYQLGAGQVTVAAGSGATLRTSGLTAKMRAQYARAGVQKVSANTWSLFGDLAAS